MYDKLEVHGVLELDEELDVEQDGELQVEEVQHVLGKLVQTKIKVKLFGYFCHF